MLLTMFFWIFKLGWVINLDTWPSDSPDLSYGLSHLGHDAWAFTPWQRLVETWTEFQQSILDEAIEQLHVEQTSKIWCKNIHAFLRNYGLRAGALYFDAHCRCNYCSAALQCDPAAWEFHWSHRRTIRTSSSSRFKKVFLLYYHRDHYYSVYKHLK